MKPTPPDKLSPTSLAIELCNLSIFLHHGPAGTTEKARKRMRQVLIEAANRLEAQAGTGRTYDAQGYLTGERAGGK